jgi:hypothetical protein
VTWKENYGKIADGNGLERVLNDIKDGGYREFPTMKMSWIEDTNDRY